MTWMGAALRAAVGTAWRHRWTYAVPVATLVLPATLYAVRQPDVYRARAVVIVRPLENAAVGGGLPQERASQTYELVQTSRDRLLTFANAGPVVPILYPGHASNDPWALESVRGRITWDRAGDSAFAVSLEDTSPQVAADAVNGVLKAFQENEKKLKLDAAEGLQRSYETQLSALQTEAQGVVERLDDFRARNADVLPELEATISNEIGQLRSEVTSQDQAASSARSRAQFLGEQITRWSATATEAPARRTSAEEDKLKAQLDQQQKATDETRKELIKARTDRTDKHPDVKKLKQQLELLEADVKATVAALDAARRSAQAESSQDHQAQTRTVVDDMRAMRTETEKEEQRYVEAAQELRERIKGLQARLARMTPALRTEQQKLQRDVEGLQRSVEQSEGRVASARAIADHLRVTPPNDVTGYRVDEWAVAPVLPSGPARWKYLAGALGLGLVIGYGVRSLRKRYEQPPLARPQELRELLPGALVVTVPLLPDGMRGPRRLPLREVALGLWVVVAFGTSALALAARKGIVTPPEWLKPIVGGRA